MKTWNCFVLLCATVSIGGLANASANSCIDLSDAKYTAKTANFSTFEARANTQTGDTTRVIIAFRERLETLNLSSMFPGRIVHQLKIINAVAAEIPINAIEQIAKDPRVRFIEHDGKVHALNIPNSTERVPAPEKQVTPHGITRSNATKAWAQSTGKGVTVAIIDTGIDSTHADLAGRVTDGANFSTSDRAAWRDGHGHGTHVSGTVAANNDSIGVVGMAPDASLLAVKVLDDYGSGSYSNVTAGIEWSIGKAQVANMSLGGTSDNQALREALIKAHKKGLIVIAAAGNSGEDWGNPPNYPAAYPEVVSTAAVDQKDLRAYFSTYNKFVAIAAHGVAVMSCDKGGLYAKYSGTSMATPHVAGATALLRQTYPNESVVDLKRRLVCNAEDQWPQGRDNWTGHGILNVTNSLENEAPESCDYLDGPVQEPVIAAPVVKPDPSEDAEVTYVKSTALTMINDGANKRQLLVTMKLVDGNQKPVSGADLTSEIMERGTGPLGSATARTNSAGEAQFVLSGFRCGRYITRVKASSAANFSTEYGQSEAEVDLGR